MPKIVKYYHLRTSTKGQAAAVIGGIDFNEDKYEEAVKCLKKRFENKRFFQLKYTNKLLAIGADRFDKARKLSAKQLEAIYNDVNHSLQALETVGINTTDAK